jgi:hypothetical protein
MYWTVKSTNRLVLFDDVKISATAGANFGSQEFLEDCASG